MGHSMSIALANALLLSRIKMCEDSGLKLQNPKFDANRTSPEGVINFEITPFSRFAILDKHVKKAHM